MGRTACERAGRGTRELCGRIELWRRTRRGLSRMPQELWDEAVQLARREGVYAVARAASIDYGGLKRRLAQDAEGKPDAVESGPFLEMSGAQLLGAGGAPGPVIEVSDDGGARLTIRLPLGSALDARDLVQGFWARRP